MTVTRNKCIVFYEYPTSGSPGVPLELKRLVVHTQKPWTVLDILNHIVDIEGVPVTEPPPPEDYWEAKRCFSSNNVKEPTVPWEDSARRYVNLFLRVKDTYRVFPEGRGRTTTDIPLVKKLTVRRRITGEGETETSGSGSLTIL